MVQFQVTDLLTQDEVILNLTTPCLSVFFTLDDILIIKEMNKDIASSSLDVIGIYIGKEPKKLQLWKSKEKNCFPLYNGGQDLKSWRSFNIQELPFVLITKNNDVVFRNNLYALGKPFFRSLLQQLPEFRTLTVIPEESKEDHAISVENREIANELERKTVATHEKINNLERVGQETHEELEILRKDLEEKDKLINDILGKMYIIFSEKYNENKTLKKNRMHHHKEPAKVPDDEYWRISHTSDEIKLDTNLWISKPTPEELQNKKNMNQRGGYLRNKPK